MWLLTVYLPLMIAEKVPEDGKMWQCFLLLLDIIKICTARVVSPCMVDYLKSVIEQHHTSFRDCYPQLSITPKLHYMVHFPEQIRK